VKDQDSRQNVISICKDIAERSASNTIELLMTEEFFQFMLDEGEKRFVTIVRNSIDKYRESR
jgi:hypothetical protein